MKIAVKVILLLMIGLIISFNLFGQKTEDLAGTWIGPATLEGEGDPNELTLVLELEEGELKGHMTGQYGTLNQSVLSDIELGDGVFKFTVQAIGPGGGEIAIDFEMSVEGETMKGTLNVPDMGVGGTWEADKQ